MPVPNKFLNVLVKSFLKLFVNAALNFLLLTGGSLVPNVFLTDSRTFCTASSSKSISLLKLLRASLDSLSCGCVTISSVTSVDATPLASVTSSVNT